MDTFRNESLVRLYGEAHLAAYDDVITYGSASSASARTYPVRDARSGSVLLAVQRRDRLSREDQEHRLVTQRHDVVERLDDDLVGIRAAS
jgi:hypothetical protein